MEGGHTLAPLRSGADLHQLPAGGFARCEPVTRASPQREGRREDPRCSRCRRPPSAAWGGAVQRDGLGRPTRLSPARPARTALVASTAEYAGGGASSLQLPPAVACAAQQEGEE